MNMKIIMSLIVTCMILLPTSTIVSAADSETGGPTITFAVSEFDMQSSDTGVVRTYSELGVFKSFGISAVDKAVDVRVSQGVIYPSDMDGNQIYEQSGDVISSDLLDANTFVSYTRYHFTTTVSVGTHTDVALEQTFTDSPLLDVFGRTDVFPKTTLFNRYDYRPSEYFIRVFDATGSVAKTMKTDVSVNIVIESIVPADALGQTLVDSSGRVWTHSGGWAGVGGCWKSGVDTTTVSESTITVAEPLIEWNPNTQLPDGQVIHIDPVLVEYTGYEYKGWDDPAMSNHVDAMYPAVVTSNNIDPDSSDRIGDQRLSMNGLSQVMNVPISVQVRPESDELWATTYYNRVNTLIQYAEPYEPGNSPSGVLFQPYKQQPWGRIGTHVRDISVEISVTFSMIIASEFTTENRGVDGDPIEPPKDLSSMGSLQEISGYEITMTVAIVPLVILFFRKKKSDDEHSPSV